MNAITRLGLGIVAGPDRGRTDQHGTGRAATITVSPGDRVDYVSPAAGTQFCTIGYVYTAPDLHTYAITAGHCRTTAAGYARDNRSGLTGGLSAQSSIPPSVEARTMVSSTSASDPCRCHSSATPRQPTTTRSHESGNWCVIPGYPAANTAAASLPPMVTTNS